MHPYITEMYKNYFMYSADRQAQLVKDKETWRTNIKSAITHMYTSGVYNMVIDSDIRFTCIDKNGEMPKMVNAMLDIVEYTAAKEETDDAIWSSVLDAILLGFGFFRSSWVYKEVDLVAKKKDGTLETIPQKYDYGVLRYMSPYNVFGPKYRSTLDKRIECERRLIPSTHIEDEYAIY